MINLNFTVKRNRISATQGSATVFCNGVEIITFGDRIELINGEWKSKIKDENFIHSVMFPNEIIRNAYPQRVKLFEDKIKEASQWQYL